MEERRALEGVVRARSERMDRVLRARALLVVADTQSFAAAARAAGFRSVTTVATLVGRFNRQSLQTLVIAPGRGRRPTYGLEARA